MTLCYPFELIPLPYETSSLEPYIDVKTMDIHHNRHLKAYVDNLNHALEYYPNLHNWSLEKLICNANQLPTSIREVVERNAGGVYNHNFYFAGMGNTLQKEPIGELAAAIDHWFGSFLEFQAAWKAKALQIFGSGYLWLVRHPCGKLMITATANQETTLPTKYCAILTMDVWEHAYYLKHYNKRADYIDDYFHVINWVEAEAWYRKCNRGKVNARWANNVC